MLLNGFFAMEHQYLNKVFQIHCRLEKLLYFCKAFNRKEEVVGGRACPLLFIYSKNLYDSS